MVTETIMKGALVHRKSLRLGSLFWRNLSMIDVIIALQKNEIVLAGSRCPMSDRDLHLCLI